MVLPLWQIILDMCPRKGKGMIVSEKDFETYKILRKKYSPKWSFWMMRIQILEGFAESKRRKYNHMVKTRVDCFKWSTSYSRQTEIRTLYTKFTQGTREFFEDLYYCDLPFDTQTTIDCLSKYAYAKKNYPQIVESIEDFKAQEARYENLR